MVNPTHSVCTTPNCANLGLVASHPRSPTPGICGICGRPVRLFSAARSMGDRDAEKEAAKVAAIEWEEHWQAVTGPPLQEGLR